LIYTRSVAETLRSALRYAYISEEVVEAASPRGETRQA
jgi:hypothetical protein